MDEIGWKRISEGALERVAPNAVKGVSNQDGEPIVSFYDHATAEQRQAVLDELKNPRALSDADLERIKTILAKSDADITAGELKELVLKFVRKRL